MTSLKDLLSHYNTDKEKYHSYGDTYTSLLDPLRHVATSVVEIGVWTGESLRVWRDFFPYAQIYGIENEANFKVDELRIETHIFDASDERAMFDFGWHNGPFDIIIDDGSHQINHQLQSLLYLYPFLKPGRGIYIIEDIQDPRHHDIFRFLGGHIHKTNEYYDSVLAVFEKGGMNYGFKCPNESCNNRAQFNFLTPMQARPKCPSHNTHYVADIVHSSAVGANDTISEDVTITPEFAKELLDTAFPSSLEHVDELLVRQYADLMRRGQWKGVTKEMGGEHYPIYMRDDKLLLGVQRLQACVQADTSFDTVIVRTYGYY